MAPRGADYGLRGPRDEPGFVGRRKILDEQQLQETCVSDGRAGANPCCDCRPQPASRISVLSRGPVTVSLSGEWQLRVVYPALLRASRAAGAQANNR